MLQEFKKFAMRGNILDLAIGIILGGSFGKIVTSFVNDILMPPIGLMIGKVDFSNLYLNLSTHNFESLADAKKAGAPTVNFGNFINQGIDFVIVAFAIFLLMKLVNKLHLAETEAKPATKNCPFCCNGIPLAATRCPFCTSQLPEVAQTPA